MLSFLTGLPAIAVLLIGLLGGGAVTGGIGGVAFWAWSTFVEAPRVAIAVKAATDRADDACTIRTQAAADAATTAAEAHQQQVSDDALRIYQAAVDQQAAAKQAAEDELSQEIEAHDAELRKAGRSFIVTDGDFDWLRSGRRSADH